MIVLNEKSQRYLMLTIFFLLGPGMLILLCHNLFIRTFSKNLPREGEQFLQAIGYDIKFCQREFLRPGTQRLLNTTLFYRQTKEPIVFCPEVYIIKGDKLAFLSQIAKTLEQQCPEHSHLFTNGEKKGDSATSTNRTSSYRKSLVTVLNENSNLKNSLYSSRKHVYTLIFIPTIFYCSKCQSSAITDLTQIFQDNVSTIVNSLSKPAICVFTAEKIVFQNEIEFSQTINTKIPTVTRESRVELANHFINWQREQKSFPPKKLPYTEVKECISALGSSLPTINQMRIMVINDSQQMRIDSFFDLEGIWNPHPYLASIEIQKDKILYKLEYNSEKQTTPCSFFSLFFHPFEIFGSTSWFSGHILLEQNCSNRNNTIGHPNIEISSKAHEKESPKLTFSKNCVLRLEDFHLQNINLESICSHLNILGFSGNIKDLCIDTGSLDQGVFEGIGTIKLQDGTISQKLLQNLSNSKVLEIVPHDILTYRYLNDAVPFNDFEIQFRITQKGIIFDSPYHNKIIACYQKGNVKYGVFIPTSLAGKYVTCTQPLSIMLESDISKTFWTDIIHNTLKMVDTD